MTFVHNFSAFIEIECAHSFCYVNEHASFQSTEVSIRTHPKIGWDKCDGCA